MVVHKYQNVLLARASLCTTLNMLINVFVCSTVRVVPWWHKATTHLGKRECVARDVGFLNQLGDGFSPRNVLLWPGKRQICDAELGCLSFYGKRRRREKS